MNPWHALTHWLMSDMYTLEERELMREQTRRLKLRTDLQEARIAARRERDMTWRAVGVWKEGHRYAPDGKNWFDAYATFHLEERADGKARRVRPGTTTRMDNGSVVGEAKLSGFFTERSAYTVYVQQWLQGSMTHDDLRTPLAADKGIKITMPRRRK